MTSRNASCYQRVPQLHRDHAALPKYWGVQALSEALKLSMSHGLIWKIQNLVAQPLRAQLIRLLSAQGLRQVNAGNARCEVIRMG